MAKLVTVAIPVYNRLHYLPQALKSVSQQDYPHIELIVSDNGMNGARVPELVDQYYSRPYKLRQNAKSVPLIEHFNQIIEEASGEYFVLLCDDDEISSNYISELSNILDSNPQVSVAFAKIEAMDESGHTFTCSNENVPPIMSGPDFIQAWCLHPKKYNFICFVTNMARTRDVQLYRYPDIEKGTNSDNALVIKLCLDNYVAFSPRCTFRYRVYEASHGLALSYQELAAGIIGMLDFLDTDPLLREFAHAQPEQWASLKKSIIKMEWKTYFWRWHSMYRDRLSSLQWLRAAFALPFIPPYYAAVFLLLGRVSLSFVKHRLKSLSMRAT